VAAQGILHATVHIAGLTCDSGVYAPSAFDAGFSKAAVVDDGGALRASNAATARCLRQGGTPRVASLARGLTFETPARFDRPPR
jgi:hypothetical protein